MAIFGMKHVKSSVRIFVCYR